MKAETQVDLLVADEAWIATALLHHEQPDREDFSVREIVARATAENITGTLRPGVKAHVQYHGVANRAPEPVRIRMLYATDKGRRLYREGDACHAGRTGKITPEPDDIPEEYRFLLDWYRREYASPPQVTWLRGIFEMVGAGKDVFAGVDPDEYVRRNREGWE
jgi:hypothetical protein